MSVEGSAASEVGTDGPTVVVVGIDGSPSSLRAVAYAAGVARRHHARLVCVYARPDQFGGLGASALVAPGSEVVVQALLGAEDAFEDDLRQLVLDNVSPGSVDVELRCCTGEPADVLGRVADSHHADVIVIGASRHLRTQLFGSVGRRLVRHAHWPVTVVP